MELDSNELESKEFIAEYGSLTEDLRIDTYSLYFYPIFMVRRLFYVVLLFIIYQYPKIQLSVIIITNLIPMLFYLVKVLPFDGIVNNLVNIYNESVLFICFLSALIMNLFEFSNKIMTIWGWILIGLILGSLAISWLTLFPVIVKQIIDGVKYIFGITSNAKITPSQNYSKEPTEQELKNINFNENPILVQPRKLSNHDPNNTVIKPKYLLGRRIIRHKMKKTAKPPNLYEKDAKTVRISQQKLTEEDLVIYNENEFDIEKSQEINERNDDIVNYEEEENDAQYSRK